MRTLKDAIFEKRFLCLGSTGPRNHLNHSTARELRAPCPTRHRSLPHSNHRTKSTPLRFLRHLLLLPECNGKKSDSNKANRPRKSDQGSRNRTEINQSRRESTKNHSSAKRAASDVAFATILSIVVPLGPNRRIFFSLPARACAFSSEWMGNWPGICD
jgi:hypothetical protein